MSDRVPPPRRPAAVVRVASRPNLPGPVHSGTLKQLCDPELMSLEEAVREFRLALKGDPSLELQLARLLPRRDGTAGLQGAHADRALHILDATSDGRRLVYVLGHLADHADPRLRSKAARFLGRRVQNTEWTKRYYREADARVRANMIEALWGQPDLAVRELLAEAAEDRNARVAVNALYGLYLLGDVRGAAGLRDAAHDARPDLRCAAAWAMGKSADPTFLDELGVLAGDPIERVKKRSVEAAARIWGNSKA